MYGYTTVLLLALQVVEIKLDKEITDSLSGWLNRVLQEQCDSPPRQETVMIDQLPHLQIKEEKDDDGYDDLAAAKLIPKSQEEALQKLAGGSPVIRSLSQSCALEMEERRSAKQSVGKGSSNSDASLGTVRHFDAFSSVSEVESMPVSSRAATGSLDPVPRMNVNEESSAQHEVSRIDGDRKSDSGIFVLETKTHALTGVPINPICELESVSSVPVECSREPEYCKEEVVVSDAETVVAASSDGFCMEPESCDNVLEEETVTSDNICIELDYLSKDIMRSGGVNMERDSVCVELDGCDNVQEEVVISDTICVEPTLDDDDVLGELFDHAGITRNIGGITDKACLESASGDVVVHGETGELVNDMETEPTGDCVSGTALAHDDVLDVQSDSSVCDRAEQAVRVEPDACTPDVCSTSEAEQVTATAAAVEVPAQIKETEEQGFLMCVDSSGRVFRIPRHLVQSGTATKIGATAKIGATVQVSTVSAQPTKTSATNNLNSAVNIIGTPEQTTVTLTSASSQTSATKNRFTACENVNRVSMNSMGLRNLANVAMKEGVCVVGRGGKPGGVLGATNIILPGTGKVRGIIRGEPSLGGSIAVVPGTGSGSLPTRNAMILPVQRNSNPKTMTLVSPGSVHGVRVVNQSQSIRLGPALPGVRMTGVQSGLSKTVVVRSVGLGPNQSQVVLGNMRTANLTRTSGGGTVTFLATKRPRGAASVSSVRVLPPGVTASPVLPSPTGPVTRLLHSQVRPVVRALPSQVSPVIRSLPSQVFPMVRSLPAQANPAVGSLCSRVSPVQRSVQQSCSTSQPKVDSPPVFLLVPSEVKGHQVTPNSPQPAVRHVLFVPKGTKVSSSGLSLASHQKIKNVTGIQPVKLLSGIAGTQDAAPLASASTGIRLATDNSGKAKAVSILRPPGPPSSNMTSLLKKNLFVQPAVPPVSLAQVEGQHPGTPSNNILQGTKSPIGKSVIQPCPSNLARAAETLLTTQIGNQTVIVKLDSSEKFGHEQSKKNDDLKSNDPCPLTPSVVVTPENNRLPAARPKEKHLMFKTLRSESSQRRSPEDVTANIK